MRISFKTLLFSALGLMTFSIPATLTSCKVDNCKSTVCAYGGQCNEDGSCTCLAGYEGERCETITREKFKGILTVLEDGTSSNPASYAVSVENGNEIDQVIIRNIYNNFNEGVTATVKGDTILIPQQTITDSIIYTVEGKGWVVPEAFYGLHGKMIMKYRIGKPDGTYDDFGFLGGAPSEWTK